MTWRSSLSTSWSIDARMSGEASLARRTGPFVQIVASATLFSAMDGFFSSASWSFDPRIVELPFQLPELLLRVAADGFAHLDVPAFDLELHRALLRPRSATESSGRPVRTSRPRLASLAFAQRGCGRRGRGAAGEHVVDERDPGRCCGGRGERTGDVPPAVRQRQPALMRDRARSRYQRLHRKLPALAELVRQPLRRVVAAREHPLPVGRHECERGRAPAA